MSRFPEGTEGHKTLENSISRDCLVALGNAVGMTATSVDTHTHTLSLFLSLSLWYMSVYVRLKTIIHHG